LAALAVIPLGLVAGVVVWAASGGDRRRAVNRTYSLWGRLGLAAAGIGLQVDGAEWLAAPRPAVFVLNHQSGVDPLLTAALLQHDFVGVAKRELRHNPLFGPALAFAGTVFVDRFDPERAREQLAPGVETLCDGLSIAVTPEGTRSEGRRLGRFKRGGFRLALAARVPIVPIVLHDSGDVLPRGAWVMRPATVRVQVLAPIPTRDWREDQLDEHIADVEDRVREALDP